MALALLLVHATGAASPCFIADGACGLHRTHFGLALFQAPFILAAVVACLSLLFGAPRVLIPIWKAIVVLIVVWGFVGGYVLFSYVPLGPAASKVPDIFFLFVVLNLLSAVLLPYLLWPSRPESVRQVARGFCVVGAAAAVVLIAGSALTWLRVEQRASALSEGAYTLLIPVYRTCNYVPIQPAKTFWLPQYSRAFEPYDVGLNPYHLLLLPNGKRKGDAGTYHWSFEWMDFVEGTNVPC